MDKENTVKRYFIPSKIIDACSWSTSLFDPHTLFRGFVNVSESSNLTKMNERLVSFIKATLILSKSNRRNVKERARWCRVGKRRRESSDRRRNNKRCRCCGEFKSPDCYDRIWQEEDTREKRKAKEKRNETSNCVISWRNSVSHSENLSVLTFDLSYFFLFSFFLNNLAEVTDWPSSKFLNQVRQSYQTFISANLPCHAEYDCQIPKPEMTFQKGAEKKEGEKKVYAHKCGCARVSHSSPREREALNSMLSWFLQLLLPADGRWLTPGRTHQNTESPQHQ